MFKESKRLEEEPKVSVLFSSKAEWNKDYTPSLVTHSSIPAWEIPRTEPGGPQSMGHKELDMTAHAHWHAYSCSLWQGLIA